MRQEVAETPGVWYTRPVEFPPQADFLVWLRTEQEKVTTQFALGIVGDPHDAWNHPLKGWLRARGFPVTGWWRYEVRLSGDKGGNAPPEWWMVGVAEKLARHPRAGVIKAHEALALLA